MTGPEQRTAALALANQRRTAKVKIKANLAGMQRHDAVIAAAGLVEDATAAAGALSVAELVRSLPRHGDAAIRRACRHAGIISGDRKLRELTPRQRRELAFVLRSRSLLEQTIRPRTEEAA